MKEQQFVLSFAQLVFWGPVAFQESFTKRFVVWEVNEFAYLDELQKQFELYVMFCCERRFSILSYFDHLLIYLHVKVLKFTHLNTHESAVAMDDSWLVNQNCG